MHVHKSHQPTRHPSFDTEHDNGKTREAVVEHSLTTRPPIGRPVLRSLHIYACVGILLVNYFLAQYDKFILSYFQDSVLSSLSLTGTEYGLLSGYSTGIVYALLALPVAFLADYTSARVWVLSISSCWWSLCVVFQGLAHNFGQVYCARLGMGIGQAAVEALSVSLISDLIEWRNVFVGESVFYVGVYLGEAISGNIATAFTRTHTSWQVAMRAIGITGIVVSVLLRLVLREPQRRPGLHQLADAEAGPEAEEAANNIVHGIPANQRTQRRTLRAAWQDLQATIGYLARMRSFWLLVASAAMRQLAGNVFGYYMPSYLSNTYPSQPDLLSRYGIIVGAVGSSTVLSGGLLTSALWRRTKLTPIYLTAIGGFISSIFVLCMIFSREIAGSSQTQGLKILYGTMAAAYATAETWLGCLFALVALLLPPAYKTFGLAIWGSIQVLVYSSGPEIIGLALKGVNPDTPEYSQVTQICLAVIIPLGYWVCGVGLLLAIPLVRKDLAGDFVRGPLGAARRYGFGAALATLGAIVVVLFVTSLVYGV